MSFKIPGKVVLGTYRISFEYETKRNNKKHREVEIRATSKEQAEFWFDHWWQATNELKEFEAYKNVEVISCEKIKQELIEV